MCVAFVIKHCQLPLLHLGELRVHVKPVWALSQKGKGLEHVSQVDLAVT